MEMHFVVADRGFGASSTCALCDEVDFIGPAGYRCLDLYTFKTNVFVIVMAMVHVRRLRYDQRKE